MSRLPHTRCALLLALAMAGSARAETSPASEPEWELVSNHRVRLHTTGRASYAARAMNVADAEIILYKTYAFADDATGRETVADLAKRARAGARVFVQYDVKGTEHSVFRLAAMALHLRSEFPAHLQPLLDAGAVLIPTNKPTLRSPFLGRDHDKLLITWRRDQPARVIMGGMNVGDHFKWSGPWRAVRVPTIAFRDADVELSGPETARVVLRFVEAASRVQSGALQSLREAALKILLAPAARASGDPRHPAEARFFHNDPKDGKQRRQIERLYEQLIHDTPAGETITISNAYMLPPKRLRAAMLEAARRGVRFKLLVNPLDAPEREARLVALAFRDQLRLLLRFAPPGSIEVLEFHGNAKQNEGSIHHKIAQFGAKGPVLIGSANLDPLSANHNSETVLVAKQQRLTRQFDAFIGRALREGKIIKLDREHLRRDSLSIKAKGFFMNRVLGRFL